MIGYAAILSCVAYVTPRCEAAAELPRATAV
jgi:hypothetical protein